MNATESFRVTAPQLLDCRSILEWELQRRRSHNSRYSLRAFARDLRLSPSYLSEVLAGKHHLSKARAEDLVGQLRFDTTLRQRFCELAAQSGYGRRAPTPAACSIPR